MLQNMESDFEVFPCPIAFVPDKMELFLLSFAAEPLVSQDYNP